MNEVHDIRIDWQPTRAILRHEIGAYQIPNPFKDLDLFGAIMNS